MRKIFVGFVCAVALGGCSSQPKSEIPTETAEKSAQAAEPNGTDSDLLSNGKKCPKHSKLVDGKCTIPVESDD
jgi:hypothetical protein